MRTTVILQDTVPSRSAPTDTGVAFVASMSQKGAQAPILIRSMDQFQTLLGSRQAYTVSWDWAETFFREGGNRLYFSRVCGPSPVKASLNIPGTAGTGLIATANSSGDWANGSTGGYSVQVVNGPVNGAGYRQLVVFLNAVEVARSIEFNANSQVVGAVLDDLTITLGGGTGLPPVAAAANLTAGTDDHGNVTQTQITAALDLLTQDLGPGQVCSPDWNTQAAGQALLAHAAAKNRYALCDSADITSKSTLLTAAGLLQGNTNGTYGSFLSPWLSIAAQAGATATRSVPLSAFVAAKIAQTDSLAGANQAPAGEYGKASSAFVLEAKATYSDADQAALEDAGVSLAINRYGGVLFDGDRTLAEPLGNDAEWIELANARYRMSLVARVTPIGQQFEHVRITQTTIAQFDSALTGEMMKDEASEQLYLAPGEPPGSSFIVDTGPAVNTDETIGAGILSAAIGFRPARGADYVFIYLTKVAVGDQVAA